MTEAAIRARARQAGVAVDWIDATDRPRRVGARALQRILDALGDTTSRHAPRLVTAIQGSAIHLPHLQERQAAELVLETGERRPLLIEPDRGIPPIDAIGYHRLRHGDCELTIAVAPPRCVSLADVLANERSWGLAVQLYALRRNGDGGVGDSSTLAPLAHAAASMGADAIALSPTHSLFPHDLTRYGPYAPSTRLFLNPLLADPAVALGRARVAAAAGEQEPDRLLIDWPNAARAKYALLRRLFDDFAATDLARNTALAGKFIAFMRQGGGDLDQHTAFEARQGGSPAPALYHGFLQWLAFEAFDASQKAAKAAGMRIGLIGDLAIGIDRTGSQAGARPGDFLQGLSIGAPPDLFNPQGQDWGLTTFSPHALIENGFEPFIATLRANMRCCGGLRIDHAMGLMRLWLVPQGSPPSEGAYLDYPFESLLQLLALESHRSGTVVIGEDLGTVPAGFRRRCRAAGIAGMDVLWFQRNEDGFLPPDKWRDDAVAMTTTHDLPTVAGWWSGADLEVRRALGRTLPDEEKARRTERAALWRAFTAAGAARGPVPSVDQSDLVADAAVDFVARSPAPMAVVAIEDILGSKEQPNLPGTIDEHPNWSRRLPAPAHELLREPAALRRLELLRRRKP